MAEFKEVMRQRERMCDYYHECNINGCPLDDFASCVNPFECNAERYEAEVMKWAKAHPEPVYPTWGEWFTETFPKGNIGCFSPCAFYDDCVSCKRCGGCNDFYYDTPIPAYIAERLGIAPLKGTEK